MVEQKQVNIDLKRTVPIFSDTVLVANVIKNKPEEEKNKKKNKQNPEGFITLIFVDSVAQQAVSRIVMPKITAENLVKALNTNLENFGKDIKLDNKDKEKKAERKNYLG